MYIKYKNDDEKKQILDILLALGYKFHSADKLTTSEAIMDEYRGYEYVHTDYAGEIGNMQLSGYSSNALEWGKDTATIMGSLVNHKVSKRDRITIGDVGDYDAVVTKNRVVINLVKIPRATIQEIYDAIQVANTYEVSERFGVTVSNDAEHKSLMALLHSLGYNYRDEDSDDYTEMHTKYRQYKSVVVYPDKSLGGNPVHNDLMEELVFSKDLTEIYSRLGNTPKTMELGTYTCTIYKDKVTVGCQEISPAKVKEILDAFETLNK